MANAPELNLEPVAGGPAEQRRHRAVSEVFEPGSTGKVITAAAALESGGEHARRPAAGSPTRSAAPTGSVPATPTRTRPSGTPSPGSSPLAATSARSGRGPDRRPRRCTTRCAPSGSAPGPASACRARRPGCCPGWHSWSGSQRYTVAFGQGCRSPRCRWRASTRRSPTAECGSRRRSSAGPSATRRQLVPAPEPQTHPGDQRAHRRGELLRMLEAAAGDGRHGRPCGRHRGLPRRRQDRHRRAV